MSNPYSALRDHYDEMWEEVGRLNEIIQEHEAAMREGLALVKYMANNWPGCACDSEDKCNVHLIEGILRAQLEKFDDNSEEDPMLTEGQRRRRK